jgi:hypothetical protein
VQLLGTLDGMEPVVEQDKRSSRIVQISWGRMEAEDLGAGKDLSDALAVSGGPQLGTNLARLRLQVMIKLNMPKAKWLIILTCLAVIVGITALTEATRKGSSAPTGSNKPAIAASRAVDSELAALLNDGGPSSATPARHKSNSSALVAAAAGADNQQFYQLGELLVRDGLSNTIINLSREMNGWWYEWSVWHAPASELNAFILAWRQVVTTMRSVPGEHFKFLWTIYPQGATVTECWPGSAYVDYVGTDIFDWHGDPDGTYPHTASGALDWALHWQRTLTATPGGLDWIIRFSELTGKPIIIPEWGLDFHTFGGQDDMYFLTRMTAWLKAHHAIGLYWIQGHVTSSGWPGGPLLADAGAAAEVNSPGAVNGMGQLLGGHLQYAGVYLNDQETISDATAQPVLAPWENAGYQLVLSVDIIPNPPIIKSYSGPSEPGGKPYQLSAHPDVVAKLRQEFG